MASAKPTDKDLTPHTMKPVQAVAMRFDNRPPATCKRIGSPDPP